MVDNKNSFKMKQSNTHTFNIDFNSTVDQMRYTGTFTCKKLNIRDISALGVRKAQLNGGMYHDSDNIGRGVDESTDSFNGMIAHLEIAILKAPDWWNFDTIGDMNLIGAVFQEVYSFETSFLRPRGEANSSGEGSQAGSGTATAQANGAGSVVQMVEQKVQSALEP